MSVVFLCRETYPPIIAYNSWSEISEYLLLLHVELSYAPVFIYRWRILVWSQIGKPDPPLKQWSFFHATSEWTPKFFVTPPPPTPPDFFAPHTPIISSVVCLSVLVLFLIYIFHAQMSETSAGKFRHKRMENNSNKFKNHFQYSTIQYNTIQYNTIQYNTIQYTIQNSYLAKRLVLPCVCCGSSYMVSEVTCEMLLLVSLTFLYASE